MKDNTLWYHFAYSSHPWSVSLFIWLCVAKHQDRRVFFLVFWSQEVHGCQHFIYRSRNSGPRSLKMFRYFLHGFKMIVPAAGIMPLFAKGRRKRPEETWWVLITDLPAIYYFTSNLQTEQLETIYYHHICLCILPRFNWLSSLGISRVIAVGLVLGTTEGFPGLRVQGDSLMWLSWCCQWAGNSAEMPTLPPGLAAGFWEGTSQE